MEKLEKYLTKEYKEGRSEFRLVVLPDGRYYVHPDGQDGETFDGDLRGLLHI